MIDRRRLIELGLGAGVSLATPALAMAAGRKHSTRHVHAHGGAHAHGHGRGHKHGASRRFIKPVSYDDLHMSPLRLEPVSTEPRAITLKNLHTDEALDAVYWDGGRYVPDALDAVNRVLRDFRTGEVHPIDPGVLEVMTDLRAVTGSKAPFQVISGYRSAQTNAMLRERSAEVAQRSFHLDGMAIDLYLDDVELDRLHLAALELGRGGVGYYPVTKFVHLDVGPLRHWEGA